MKVVLLYGVLEFSFELPDLSVIEWIKRNYKYIFLGTVILELLLWKIVFPLRKMAVTVEHGGILNFTFKNTTGKVDKRKIKDVSFWWNYSLGRGENVREFLGERGRDGGMQGRGINSTLGGRGVANRLWLDIKLTDDTGKSFLLCERLPNWASTPNWPYSLENGDSIPEKHRCFGLQKALKRFSL